MSDNISDEEQQQQMEEISICADVWLEVFACIGPLELGHLMALISDRFDRLVDEHFKTRKWSLGSLHIRRAIDGNGAQINNDRTGEELPIPQGPLPNKVIGFQLRRPNRHRISSTHLPPFNADASSSQAAAKWLLTPREDGLPKMLYCDFSSGRMEELKESFGNASWPVNFIIIFWIMWGDDDVVPFELENTLTGERMTLRQMDEGNWLLVRCPIVREEAKWAVWEREGHCQWNRISIDFYDGDIGDEMIDAKAGPSEPKK